MRQNFKTYQLAVQFYHLAVNLQLPRHPRDQMVRSASSVALNLAEGSGKSSKADQKRYFETAFGSRRESQAVLDLTAQSAAETLTLADKLAAHLFRLIQSCKW